MKKLAPIIFLLAIHYSCYSQLKASFAEDTVTIIRDMNEDKITYPKISVSGTNTGSTVNDINVELIPGTPSIYKLEGKRLVPNEGTSQMKFPFVIPHGSNSGNDTVYLGIKLSYFSGSTPGVDTMVVRVVNNKGENIQDESDDGFHTRLTYLNAFNFDFYGKLKSNYVGVLNIYEPARYRGKKGDTVKILGFPTSIVRSKKRAEMDRRKYGFNIGIMKINYGLGTDPDTANQYRLQNVKISPLDSILPGNKYLRQYNKYAKTSSNSAWSFYVQPLTLINPLGTKGTKARVYLHAHLELLVSKLTTRTEMSNVVQDTAIIPSPIPNGMIFRTQVEDVVNTTDTKYDGYFGLGPTFDISLTKNSSLFLQATLGKTTNNPDISSVPEIKFSEIPQEPKKWQGFYLIRASFNMKLSDASNLVIALDIRGLFPRYNPLYATYIGLNVKVEELLKLIKG